jgi:hypothetical protein
VIEDAIKAIVEPILNALTPAVPFYWGIAAKGKTEYVCLTDVNGPETQDDDGSDDKQLNIVTHTSMTRAKAIEMAIKTGIHRYKGVASGIKISSITHTRSVSLPDPATGEFRIAAEYHVNYEGGII